MGDRNQQFVTEDRSATKREDGPVWRSGSDTRGKSCFDGEEHGSYAGTKTPLINEAKPTL